MTSRSIDAVDRRDCRLPALRDQAVATRMGPPWGGVLCRCGDSATSSRTMSSTLRQSPGKWGLPTIRGRFRVEGSVLSRLRRSPGRSAGRGSGVPGTPRQRPEGRGDAEGSADLDPARCRVQCCGGGRFEFALGGSCGFGCAASFGERVRVDRVVCGPSTCQREPLTLTRRRLPTCADSRRSSSWSGTVR